MFGEFSVKSKISLFICIFIMACYFVMQVMLEAGVLPLSHDVVHFGTACISLFIMPFGVILVEIVGRYQSDKVKKKALERILDESCLVSRTDRQGRITEVNDKFCEVSGYLAQELLGQDHKLLNSGLQPRSYWANMYTVTVKYKSIWHDIVTNRAKDGSLYHVKTWIMANFDEQGKLAGFLSVRQDVTSLVETLQQIDKKNDYLEHAAKILRHDMHSGINTYLPRGIKSLERRLEKKPEVAKQLNLGTSLKLIKDGLAHTQKVYAGVFEFTNLVRKDASLNRKPHDTKEILKNYLSLTSYSDQVVIDRNLPVLEVNEALFCTAIDNMIRNGLKYNDSKTKMIMIKMVDEKTLAVIDNGRGMSQEDFEELSKPYLRKKDQKEKGTGLGLSITTAILKEHGYEVSARKQETGTMMRIKIK
jgi:PAS domain S-box-containing protein